MFKKKKKDKQKDQLDKNERNRTNGDSMSSQIEDEIDGFDKNGFVDLQPIESDDTVLGPRQKCKYVGTFAVVSGTDGVKTLKTHKERTKFIKDRLSDYRDKRNGIDVVLQVSSGGIKVFNFDASNVRMAYPLQRISFATCDPDFHLFAFMTYSPTPEGVAVHGHVFAGGSSKQVQDLTAMIGKAFKMAFASSKLQKKHGVDMGDLVPSPTRPARRWAKHEIHRGHDHSEHAAFAKDRKRAQYTSGIPYGSDDSSPGNDTKLSSKPGWRHGSPGGTPPTQRKFKGLSLGSRFAGEEDVVSDSMSDMSLSTNNTMPNKTFERGLSDSSASQPYSPHRELNISNNYPTARSTEGGGPQDVSVDPPPLPPRVHARVGRSESDPIHPATSRPLTRTEELLQEAATSPANGNIARGSSLPSSVTYVGSMDEESTGSKTRSDTIERPATHHDEYWYMPGIPREFILEMLQSSEEGSFFVRDSQSRPGSHALTVKVPAEFVPDGYANYLITSTPEGIKLEGFSKAFPDLMTLIEHYARQPDELPCKLTLGGSNMLCENVCENTDDTMEYAEPVDPDYRLLSDFHSMMDELKH